MKMVLLKLVLICQLAISKKHKLIKENVFDLIFKLFFKNNVYRFPNEVKMINELGGDCWFIVRPKMDNVSNHESETALKWQDFDKIINSRDRSLAGKTLVPHGLFLNKVYYSGDALNVGIQKG